MSKPTKVQTEIESVLGVKRGKSRKAYEDAVVKAYGDAKDETLDKLSKEAVDYIGGLSEEQNGGAKVTTKSDEASDDKPKAAKGKKAAKAKKAPKVAKAKKAAKPKAAKKAKTNGNGSAKRGPSHEDVIRSVVFANPMIDGAKLVEKVRAKGCDASERTIGTQAATFRGALRFLKRADALTKGAAPGLEA